MAAAKLTELKCKLFGLLIEQLDVRQAVVNVAEARAEARARVESRHVDVGPAALYGAEIKITST